jgi:hypothetical protein
MFDNTIDPNDPAFREVTRHLEAYADLRLSPSAAATTRMRMRVMNTAHRRAALIQADATFGAADLTVSALAAQRARVVRHEWRRPVAAVFAACLTLGLVVGTAFAANPGGPLYAARMWTEMANLPSGPVDRANAEVGRLEQRLTEAQQASTAGDTPAAEAALAAYTQILAEATEASSGDPTASAAIELSVSRHVAVLTLLAGTVPEAARGAVEQALASSTMVLQDLGVPGTKGGNGGNGDTGGNGGNGSNGGANGGGNGGGAATGTTKPPKSGGAPTDPPNPAVTHKPDKSPAPNPSDIHGTVPSSHAPGRSPSTPQPTPTPTPRPAP